MKGIIFYTHGDIDPNILNGVQNQISKSYLPIVSCTLKPMNFGLNIVYDGKKGIMSYFHQIVEALEASTTDYVFFCEHDVLYHASHFDFKPTNDDTFYYNSNCWKWAYPTDRVITYDHQASVSGLCCNRQLALDFYRNRLKIIYENGYDKLPTAGNPSWARKMGYEPGRNDGRSEEWRSKYPIIDIRHSRNMTPKKMEQEDFRKKPTGWKEDVIENLPGWHEPWKLVT